MFTGAQCRAARAFVEISRDALAKLAETEISAIEQFERRPVKPDAETISISRWRSKRLRRVHSRSENGSGVGVQLEFNSSSTRRLAILEAEGGIVQPDDIHNRVVAFFVRSIGVLYFVCSRPPLRSQTAYVTLTFCIVALQVFGGRQPNAGAGAR